MVLLGQILGSFLPRPLNDRTGYLDYKFFTFKVIGFVLVIGGQTYFFKKTLSSKYADAATKRNQNKVWHRITPGNCPMRGTSKPQSKLIVSADAEVLFLLCEKRVSFGKGFVLLDDFEFQSRTGQARNR